MVGQVSRADMIAVEKNIMIACTNMIVIIALAIVQRCSSLGYFLF
jgi:hypothetical protein